MQGGSRNSEVSGAGGSDKDMEAPAKWGQQGQCNYWCKEPESEVSCLGVQCVE